MGAFGRPILDATVDADGDVYVVPVVVAPDGSEPYLAGAKLSLSKGGSPPYSIIKLYDDPPVQGDNQYRDNLREIEVDRGGNVYIVNVHSLNESDILFKYNSSGVVQRLNLGDPHGDMYIPDPIALHVSDSTGLLYLTSAQADPNHPHSVVISGLAPDNLSLLRSIVIQGMQHTTGIAEDPGTGCLYVVGFNLIEPVPDYPSPFAAPFYYPCLAEILSDSDRSEASPLVSSGDHDLALPLSVVWTGSNAFAVATGQ